MKKCLIQSKLTGNADGLSGHVSGLRGDVDNCEITPAERNNGIDVSDLVEDR